MSRLLNPYRTNPSFMDAVEFGLPKPKMVRELAVRKKILWFYRPIYATPLGQECFPVKMTLLSKIFLHSSQILDFFWWAKVSAQLWNTIIIIKNCHNLRKIKLKEIQKIGFDSRESMDQLWDSNSKHIYNTVTDHHHRHFRNKSSKSGGSKVLGGDAVVQYIFSSASAVGGWFFGWTKR